MNIQVTCSGCQKQYSVDEKHAGKTGKCKYCDTPISIPYPETLKSSFHGRDVVDEALTSKRFHESDADDDEISEKIKEPQNIPNIKDADIDLSIGSIISNAFKIGFQNFFPLIGAVLLYYLTIWIPYINIGTSIALIGFVVAMSKGGTVSPTEIFHPKYRKVMGEFFLLIPLYLFGVLVGSILFIVPGIVILFAWSQALYLVIDKEINPLQAISISNKITYGHKTTLFFAYFILAVLLSIIVLSTQFIFSIGSMSGGSVPQSSMMLIAGLIGIVATIFFIVISLGASAYIYSQLSQKVK